MKKFVCVLLAAILAMGIMISVAGCGKKEVATPLTAEEKARLEAERQRKLREARLKEQAAREAEAKLKDAFVNQDIHFDYDRYDLTAEAKQILNDKASYMHEHPDIRIIIEGHCDERGSNSYNMALGEKRARAAAAYILAMGITPDRVETMSFGEERPMMMGVNEDSYAANRRAHFVIK